LPILNPAQKGAIMQRANALAVPGAAIPVIPPYVAGAHGVTTMLRRFTAMALSAPRTMARTARWALRSPWRSMGALTVMMGVYEVMNGLGVFDAMINTYAAAWDQYKVFKTQVEDISLWAYELLDAAEQWHTLIGHYVTPWKLLFYGSAFLALSLLALKEYLTDEDDDAIPSPTSSAGATPVESPASSVPGSPRQDVTDPLKLMEKFTTTITEQHAMLESVAKKTEQLQEELSEEKIERRTQELLKDHRPQPEGSGLRHSDLETLRMMKERMDKFEGILAGDRGPQEPEPTRPFNVKDMIGSSRDPSPVLVEQPASPTESGANMQMPPMSQSPVEHSTPQKTGQVVEAVTERKAMADEARRRLERFSREPKDCYARALAEFRDIAMDEWSVHFPTGFRARMAPNFLADVYSQGKRGQEWAKSWLRERQLMECPGARELTSVMSALDAMLITDMTPDFINLTGTERLCRKALGILSAYKKVQNEKDWKKPQGANKWTSKVDWAEAKRIDPSMTEEDLYQNRAAEDEIRQEVEREAMIMKSRAKLAQAKEKSDE